MLRNITVIFSLVLALVGVGMGVGPTHAGQLEDARPIRILLSTSQSIPWHMNEGTYIDWQRPGLYIELLRLAEKRTGLRFEYKRVPWNRALHMIDHHQAEGLVGSSFKKERLVFGAYPMRDGRPDAARRMKDSTYALYARRGSAVGFDGKTIRNVERGVGVDLGFSIGDDLRAQGIPVIEDKNETVNLEKLLHGRIDAYANLQSIVDHLLSANPERYRDITRIDPPLRRKAYYLMLDRKFAEENAELAETIWRAIGEARESDAFKRIAADYFSRM